MLRQEMTNESNSIALAKAEAFAIICDLLPVIFLDRNGKVTDVSERFKSCRSSTADRTVLSRVMGKADYKRLCTMCSGISHDKSEPHDDPVFDLKYDGYRYGVYYCIPSSKAPVRAMCLAVDENELELLFALLRCRFPKSLVNTYKRLALQARSPFLYSTLTLFDPNDELNASDMKCLLDNLSARIATYNGVITSHINVTTQDIPELNRGIRIKPGPLVLIYTALLHILDNSSQSNIITVNVYTDTEHYEIDMCTDTFIKVDSTVKTDNIVSLASIIPNCTAYLSAAELASYESGIYIEGQYSGGKLRFIFGTLNDVLPVLEFKYRNTASRFNELFDNAEIFLNIMTSVCREEVSSEEE